MYGLIVVGKTRRFNVKFYDSQVHGLPVSVAELGVNFSPRNWMKIGKKWDRKGVKKALYTSEICGELMLSEFGVRRLETNSFLRNYAAGIGKAYLKSKCVEFKDAYVSLKGDRMTKACYQCAKELCPQVRQLVIDLKHGSSQLKEELRWEYGMAVVENDHGYHPDLVLDFSESYEMENHVVSLTAEHLARRNIGIHYLQPMPSTVNQVELMAALWESGRLNQELIRVTF